MSKDCYDPCTDDTLTKEQKWTKTTGTEFYGNLPEYKKDRHIGHIWAPCPYSTQSDELRTRLMLKLNDVDPLPVKVYHETNGKEHFMNVDHKGNWGYTCTYSGCTHLQLTGKNYTYI